MLKRSTSTTSASSCTTPTPARGVGTALIAAVIDLADRWLNLKRLELQVWSDNHRAIALYERFGFRSVGTRPRYYADTGEDAIIMWRMTEAPSSAGPAW